MVIRNFTNIRCQTFSNDNQKWGRCQRNRIDLYIFRFLLAILWTREIVHNNTIKFLFAWHHHGLSDRPLSFLSPKHIYIMIDFIFLKELINYILTWTPSVHVPSHSHYLNVIFVFFASYLADFFHQAINLFSFISVHNHFYGVAIFQFLRPAVHWWSSISIKAFELCI